MYVEYLRFRVEPLLREQFVQQDKEIWTAALSLKPGFHKKEVWLGAEDPSEVVTALWWLTLEEWKSIPADELAEIEARFSTAMGQGTYEMVDARAYRLVASTGPQPIS